MNYCTPALLLALAVAANFSCPGFLAPVEAAKVKCRLASPPKGLNPKGHVRNSNGKKYRLSDRPGWIFVPNHSGPGWVVARCF
jgi:hypothetical protein